MNGLPYYKAYPRDFFEGTVGMDFEEKAAYRLVLDLIYMHGGRLVDDARFIAGHLGCSVKKWNALRQAILATGKLVVTDGYLGNYRADKELDSLKSFQTKQRENGRHPRKNKNLAEATAEPKANHTEPDTDREDTYVSSRPRKRATRLPETWVLPLEWGQWAVKEGWPETVIRSEADKFRDYWIGKSGKDATKADWSATWRNWMRNCKAPKVVNGDGYERTSKSADKLRAFIAGAD